MCKVDKKGEYTYASQGRDVKKQKFSIIFSKHLLFHLFLLMRAFLHQHVYPR